MKKFPLLSIIVPVYNVDKYLNGCVDSIIQQTYPNKEIILVDDGSTDSSGSICDILKEAYQDIIVLHKQNGGLSSARNAGLEIAKGEYITFIDSDDTYGDTRTLEQSMLCLLENSELDIVQFPLAFVQFDANGNEANRQSLSPHTTRIITDPSSFTELLAEWICFNDSDLHTSVCNKIFKKSVFKEKRFTNIYIEDAFFLFDIIADHPKVLIHNKGCYNYIQRANSIINSARTVAKLQDLIRVFSHCYSSLLANSKDYRMPIHCVFVRVFSFVFQN